MLKYSSIQPLYETHGFGHYLSCYYFFVRRQEGKMWAKVTLAWAAKVTPDYLLGHKCKKK